ncbi:MAG: hypothetical protein CVU06_15355, partial [Bacteroidetes bacterium HGW-Bacteroidetes-22]
MIFPEIRFILYYHLHLSEFMKTISTVFIMLLSMSAMSNEENTPDADTTYWLFKGSNSLNFNQTGVTTWAEGGESSLAGTAYISYAAAYQKGKMRSEHLLNASFGIMRTELNKLRKTEDKIDLTSTFGFQAIGNWFYTSQLNIKTQFAEGFKYPNDSTVVSKFMAPCYLTTSLGMQFKPNNNFTLFLSPASGKFTLVLDQELSDAGAFGVTPVQTDTNGQIIVPSKKVKAEFGINVTARFNRDVFENVSLDTKLELYNNYFDENKPNRW